MNFKRHLTWLLLAATLLLAACATGPTIRTDTDPTADFSRYRTWSFFNPIAMEQSGYSSWISDRIKENVRREMSARGYTYDEKNPDLKVNFQGVVQDRSEAYAVPRTEIQYLYSYRYRSYVAVPFWYDDVMVSNYKEGTLSVDIVDAAKNRMVWTGDAISRVSSRTKPEERLAEVDQAIGAIFAKYPFNAGSNAVVIPAKK